MREHMGLYRGKRIDNGEWVEGAYMPSYYSSRYGKVAAIFINDDVLCKTYRYPVDPDTVGECCGGLRDKNGKLIFEGDICQIKNHPFIDETPFVIEWNDFAYNGWTWKDFDEISAVGAFTKGAAAFSEIIGNIHDNPELLKGGEGDG